MLKAGFCLQDDTMPRTEYWKQFITTLEQSDFFAKSNPDILVPNEDTAIETNWPRYGNRNSAYLRGHGHDLSENGSFHTYFFKIVAFAKNNPTQKFLYINMHPFFRPPLIMRQLKNMIVADVSLAIFERDLNHNTISMPALPIIASRSASPSLRPILASFQGVNSHPIRQNLKRIADGKTIVVNFVERDRHVGKIDALNAKTDQGYEQLLTNSNFAFVPRGDALFSYRLLEVMSFGCIPIILSDGWVLPFDRLLPWERMSLQVHADSIQLLPQILKSLTSEEILVRQAQVISTYRTHFVNLSTIISGLMTEATGLCPNMELLH